MSNKRKIQRNIKQKIHAKKNTVSPDIDQLFENVFFGFQQKTNTVTCMVRQVTESVLYELLETGNSSFNLNDWVLTEGSCDEITVHGPFTTMEEAFNFGNQNLGVERFQSTPNHF